MDTQTATMTKDEHQAWIEEMAYWSNELNFYEKVLLQLIDYPHMDERAEELEKYEDRFADMRTRLEELATQLNLSNSDGAIRVQIHATEKDFRQLKDDFYKFSDKIDK